MLPFGITKCDCLADNVTTNQYPNMLFKYIKYITRLFFCYSTSVCFYYINKDLELRGRNCGSDVNVGFDFVVPRCHCVNSVHTNVFYLVF